MAITRDQLVQLFTAGSVTIPPHFPEVGRITVDKQGIVLKRSAEPLVTVTHCVSPLQTDTYLLRLADVSAVLLANKKGKVNVRSKKAWFLGPDVAAKFAGGDQVRGIVFVREDVCVVTQFGRSGTAGDLLDLAKRCEECK